MTILDWKLYNPETGEVKDIPKHNPNSTAAYIRKKEAEKELDFWYEENGGRYTFSVAKKIQNLFWANKAFTDTEKVRIMFISSFVGFDGYLVNGTKPITKKGLKQKLAIPKESDFYLLYNKLIAAGMIKEENGLLYWERSFAFKGGAPKGVKIIDTIRLYDKVIQNLYTQNSVKGLPIVFKLLPYVNKYTNVLCFNIDARTYKESQPLSIEEIVEIVSGGRINNFKTKLNKIMVDDNFVFATTKVGKTYHVRMNPKLVWMSRTQAPPTELAGIFEAAKDEYLSKKVKKANLREVS